MSNETSNKHITNKQHCILIVAKKTPSTTCADDIYKTKGIQTEKRDCLQLITCADDAYKGNMTYFMHDSFIATLYINKTVSNSHRSVTVFCL